MAMLGNLSAVTFAVFSFCVKLFDYQTLYFHYMDIFLKCKGELEVFWFLR